MSLKDDLAGVMPADKLRMLGHCEVIGDIAVISFPPGLEAYKADAADAVLAKRKRVKTVLNKLAQAECDRRVPHYEVLRGKDAIAVYKEYGFSYRFDISNGKKGGALHFYTFKKKHQIEGLIERYVTMGLGVELCRRCGNVAPAVSRWAFDLRKK